MKNTLPLLLLFAPALSAQFVVSDPGNTAVNTAIKANQVAQHAEVLRQWAEQLEKLNRQIRQVEDLLATQRRIRAVLGDPAEAGVHAARRLGMEEFAREYGETMAAVRRLSDAALSLRRTAEGMHRALDDRTALGTGFTRRTADYRPYAAVERQADNFEGVARETDARAAELQHEIADTIGELRDAHTQAEVDKLDARLAALNGQLAHVAARRRDEADKLLAQRVLNENQAEKERRDLFEKQNAEERQSLAALNAWQRTIRLAPTDYTRP